MSSPRTIGIYRWLLRLYPRRFREEYGDDMALLLAEQLRDGPTGRVWARSVVDIAITVPTRHLEAHMDRPPNSTVPLLFAALSVSGVVFALVVGSSVGTAGIGIAVAVASGTLAFASWRRARTITATRPVTAHWWKILLSGVGVLAATVVGVNVSGELPSGWWAPVMLILLTGILTTAAGLSLGIAQLASHRPRHAPS